jgi:hypothetical protein
MEKVKFTYTQKQDAFRRVRARLGGLRIEANTHGLNDRLAAEIQRLEQAEAQVRSEMTDAEYDAQMAHENRVLSVAELAAEAKAAIAAMDANKDKPSH